MKALTQTKDKLVGQILKDFSPWQWSGAQPLYTSNTKEIAESNKEAFEELDLSINDFSQFPDIILYYKDKKRLFLIDSVTSHGPINAKRRAELAALFSSCKANLTYVSAFLNRQTMGKYLSEISWETEVWVADAPSHLIHFNGDRFLGPHETSK